MIKFQVDKTAVKKAAKFLLKKNPQCILWSRFQGQAEVTAEDVYGAIMHDVIAGAKSRRQYLKPGGASDEWSSWFSTGGFTVIYTAEYFPNDGDWLIEAYVTVDPAVGCCGEKWYSEVIG